MKKLIILGVLILVCAACYKFYWYSKTIPRSEVERYVEDYRERYYANTACRAMVMLYYRDKFYVKGIFNLVYNKHAAAIFYEYALQGDKAAMAMYPVFREEGNSVANERLKWAQAGEPEAMANMGGRQYSNADLEKYYEESAQSGSYSGHKARYNLYYLTGQKEKLCKAVADSYKKFGLEIFSQEIVTTPEKIYSIQTICKTFGNRGGYTMKEILDSKYLQDTRTEEALFLQGCIKSNIDSQVIEAKQIFESLVSSRNVQIQAVSEYCLAYMYYHGYGTSVDKDTAGLYAERAYSKGVYHAGYIIGKRELPEQKVLLDYNGPPNGLCFLMRDSSSFKYFNIIRDDLRGSEKNHNGVKHELL